MESAEEKYERVEELGMHWTLRQEMLKRSRGRIAPSIVGLSLKIVNQQ